MADPAAVAEQERKMREKYGGLPPKKAVLGHRLKERKQYFDSGDYALQKAGKQQAGPGSSGVGSAIPTPDVIPHSHPQTALAHAQAGAHSQQGAAQVAREMAGTPVKESALVKEMPSNGGGNEGASSASLSTDGDREAH